MHKIEGSRRFCIEELLFESINCFLQNLLLSTNTLPQFQSSPETGFVSDSDHVCRCGFLNIHPSELKFPVDEKKQSSCCMQLADKTDQYIAFKVKTTNPKKYCVRPNAEIFLPGPTCNVTAVRCLWNEETPIYGKRKR